MHHTEKGPVTAQFLPQMLIYAKANKSKQIGQIACAYNMKQTKCWSPSGNTTCQFSLQRHHLHVKHGNWVSKTNIYFQEKVNSKAFPEIVMYMITGNQS